MSPWPRENSQTVVSYASLRFVLMSSFSGSAIHQKACDSNLPDDPKLKWSVKCVQPPCWPSIVPAIRAEDPTPAFRACTEYYNRGHGECAAAAVHVTQITCRSSHQLALFAGRISLSNQPLTYRPDATVLIVGVGLMGQHMASNVLDWLDVKKLILVDHASEISVGTERVALTEFADRIAKRNSAANEVVSETVDITDEDVVAEMYQRAGRVHYLMHTAGISPKPLTPPEEMTKHDVMNACEVNLWGAHNVVKQGIKSGALVGGSRGVLLLSTSATVGAEGRASSAYEESKGGLLNLLTLQSRYFAEEYGLVLNGLAPSPLRGPMAAQNEISAGRLQAVEDTMPLGGLTEPKHISAATMFFWANECWSVGEILTTDGGYTKHRPIYGPLT